MTRLLEAASYIGGALLFLILLIALLSGCAYEGPRTLRAEMMIDCERAFRHIPIRVRPGLHSDKRRAWLRNCLGERVNGTSGRFERAVRELEGKG